MQKVQKGFTLIELIVVIVLLGILGVTAMGRFQDLSADAQSAAADGIAAELSSASAVNYAEGILDGSYTVALTAANICTSPILAGLLQSQSWPTQTPVYAVSGTGDCSGGAGGTASCIIYQDTNTAVAGYDVLDINATASVVCSG